MALPTLPPRSGGAEPPGKAAKTHHLQFDLSRLGQEELLALRADIDQRLPVRALRDLDLEHELVIQLLTVQQLQRDVLSDDEVPANQRAQTANSVAAVLQQLAQLQSKVHTSERLKRLEANLVQALKEAPLEVQRAWLDGYEQMGGAQ